MSPSRSRVLKILFGVGLVLGVIGLLVVVTLFGIANYSHKMHAVVLDAGSSSTKLNLFEWQDQPFRTNAEVTLTAYDKVEPGISAYVNRPFEAYNKLSPNLATLTANLSSAQKSKTPVYMAATAGMRLELIMSPLKSLKLFEILRRGLLKSGLEVETPNERIRMLSGAEEGLYGWVSVNNNLGLISEKTQSSPLTTVGSLDLGGASTQISFVPENAPTTDETSVDFYPLKLFGTHYNVYSHSFLCFGKNEFENRIKAAVIGTQTTAEIKHPCLLSGYKLENEDADIIFSSPCVTGSYARSVFPQPLSKPAGLTKFAFSGSGDAAECQKIIQEQFNSSVCTNQPCSFNDVYQPTVRGEFRAYAGYSYVMQYFFKDEPSGLTASKVETAVKSFCSKPWSEIQTEKYSEYSAKFCFDGYFVLTLLKNLGFNTDDKFKKITFGERINNKPVSWALGYMLDQSGHLPSELPKIYLPISLFATLTAIFAVLIVVSVIGLIFGCCRGEKTRLS